LGIKLAKCEATKILVVRSANPKAVLEKAEDCAESLLTVNDLSNGAPGFGIYILAHVQFWDRLTPHYCVYEIRAGFLAPDFAPLEFGLEHKFVSRVPFVKIPNAIVPCVK
jgi:hypothetical protein